MRNVHLPSGVVIGVVLLVAVSGVSAQTPGHGGTPSGAKNGMAAEQPHAGMAMPEPMEEPIPDAGVLEFTAEEPGTWIVHCHILHHVTNDDREPGGLILAIKVTG